MWRNAEVDAFVDWLREHNAAAAGRAQRAGFYGLDLYSLDDLDRAPCSPTSTSVDPEAAAVARERYGCLTPWQKEPAAYGRAALSAGYRALRTPR